MTQKVSSDDLRMMLISSFRYALGRRTYIVGEAIRYLKTYGSGVLTDSDWGQFIYDIERGSRHNGLGDQIDRRAWLEFREWIQSKAPEAEESKGSTTRTKGLQWVAPCERCTGTNRLHEKWCLHAQE